ncbi:MAG: hypothetical protein U0989_16285 [Azonexus sp.]|nr:hypothetical protein [Azonexus sp.]
MNESLRDLGESITGAFCEAIQITNAEVDDIIRCGVQDSQRIDHQLDFMLGFCCDPEMLNVFKRLCRYYYTINPQATVEYIHAYREMWDTPEIIDSTHDFEKVPAVSVRRSG